MDKLAGYRRWADPLLRQEDGKAEPTRSKNCTSALALLPVDESKVNYLRDQLLVVTPTQFPCGAGRTASAQGQPSLNRCGPWHSTRSERHSNGSRRLVPWRRMPPTISGGAKVQHIGGRSSGDASGFGPCGVAGSPASGEKNLWVRWLSFIETPN